MDDATNTIYSGFLTEEEGTASTFRALEEVFGGHGLALSLYTDRGSHYFHTTQAGGKIDRTNLTQSVARWLTLAWSISRLIRRRHGVVRSGFSIPCKTG